MIIVRYGEIGLKSQQTRAAMENKLIKNIRGVAGSSRITKERGRIYVDSDSDELAKRLARVFGVVSTSVATKTTSDFDDIVSRATDFAKQRLDKNKTFAVKTRRTGQHTYKSPQLASAIGASIAEKTGMSVDLTSPDITIHVEARDKDAYIYDRAIKGVGGLPLGTQGKAVALISGGIDSPVAGWMMMKRGVEIVPLFMDCRPLVDDRTVSRALDTVKILSEWAGHPLRTYVAPYGDSLMKFLKYGDNRLACVLCKKMMYLVAAEIAEKEKAHAIISGDSLGQVASQTMENISTISSGISTPILRPLVGLDKTEIIDLARSIGTYDASIQPANCCLGPPLHPEIRATKEKMKKAEDELEITHLVEKSVNGLEVMEVGG